jgi:hypothetical protein
MQPSRISYKLKRHQSPEIAGLRALSCLCTVLRMYRPTLAEYRFGWQIQSRPAAFGTHKPRTAMIAITLLNEKLHFHVSRKTI